MIRHVFVSLVVDLYNWTLSRYPEGVLVHRLQRAIRSADALTIRFVMLGDDGIEHSLSFSNRDIAAIKNYLGTPSDPICRMEIFPDA